MWVPVTYSELSELISGRYEVLQDITVITSIDPVKVDVTVKRTSIQQSIWEFGTIWSYNKIIWPVSHQGCLMVFQRKKSQKPDNLIETV